MGFYIKKFKKNVFVVFAIIKTPIVVGIVEARSFAAQCIILKHVMLSLPLC